MKIVVWRRVKGVLKQVSELLNFILLESGFLQICGCKKLPGMSFFSMNCNLTKLQGIGIEGLFRVIGAKISKKYQKDALRLGTNIV